MPRRPRPPLGPKPRRWPGGATPLAALCLLLLGSASHAASSPEAAPPATLQALQVPADSLRADGVAQEPAWSRAPKTGAFVQVIPEEGAAPSEPTQVQVAYDDRALFVLVRASDSQPAAIRGVLTRRDGGSASDWIHLFLDSRDDDRTAVRLSVNPAGVRQDALLQGDGEAEDLNWDAVWSAGVTRDAEGWTVEYRIPLGQLRYDPSHPRWGLQVSRHLSRRNETSAWVPQPRASARVVSHFGVLEGLQALPSPWRVELVPYLRGALVREDGDLSPEGSVGGDARIGLGSALTLNVAVNPDFGQVEADPSELNLSSLETFYSEKRPFFLEGKQILHYPLGFGDGGMQNETLFYTRRIGRAPSRELDLDEGQTEGRPRETLILAAAKLSGRTASGWSVGLLDAVTRTERSTVEGPGEAHGERVVEPMANALVARLSRDLRGGRTVVGGMATHLARDLGPTLRTEYVEHAVAGGVDLDHRWSTWQVVGRLYGTQVRGAPQAIDEVQRSTRRSFQRPDASHLSYDPARTELSGWGLTAVAGRLTGSVLRGAAGLVMRSPGLEPNDLGYLRQADQQIGFLWAQLRGDAPPAPLQSWGVNFNVYGSRTFGEETSEAAGNVNGWVQLRSRATGYLGLVRNAPVLDVAALRGGPALAVPGASGFWAGLSTDDRRFCSVALDLWGDVGDEDSRSELGGTLTVAVRPSTAWTVSLAPSFTRQHSAYQFVDEPDQTVGGGEWTVGSLQRDTASLVLRTDWTLTRDLSLQVYVMPYLSAGAYSGFSAVTDPQAERWVDRLRPAESDADDRFLFGQLRSTVVLRWEPRPGSAAFVVWTHDQGSEWDDRGQLLPGRDVPALLGSPSADVLLVKLSWWWQA